MDREEEAKMGEIRKHTELLELALRDGDQQAATERLAAIAELWSWRYPHPSLLALKAKLSIIQDLGKEDEIAPVLVRIGMEYRDLGHRAKSIVYWRLAEEFQTMGSFNTQGNEEAEFLLHHSKTFYGEKAYHRAWHKGDPLFRWLHFPWRTDTLSAINMSCRLLGDTNLSPYFWHLDQETADTLVDHRLAWHEALQQGQNDALNAYQRGEHFRQAILLANSGCAYDRLGFSHESKTLLEQALVLFQDLGDTTNAFYTRCNLGTIELKYRRFLDLPFMFHLEMAIEQAGQLHDELRLADLHWKKGRASREDEYFQESAWCLDNACAQFFELRDYVHVFRVVRELIWTFMEMGHHHKALATGNQARTLLLEHAEQNRRETALLLSLLSMLYAAKGAEILAEQACREALSLFQEEGDQRLVAHTSVHLGILLLWQGKREQGVEFIQRG